MYVGITSHVCKRVLKHKEKIHKNSFTAKYNLNKLVCFESTDDVSVAMQREKQLKKYKRQYKFNLIEQDNFYWKDLC